MAHIVRYKTKCDLDWYLDDYFFADLLAKNCNWQVAIFLNVCEEINFPVSKDKTEWATQIIVFLGLLINSRTQTVSVPEPKRQKAMDALNRVLRSKKVKVLEMQKLTGLLNFLSRAVVPGRAFTRRMYNKYKAMPQFHHVKVDKELRSDCEMWDKFLQNPQSVCRPFADFERERVAQVIKLETDASLNKKLGFGGIFSRQILSLPDQNKSKEHLSWFSQKWPAGFINRSGCSIEVAELYGSCMALTMWAEELRGKRVVIWCDNQAVVHMINKTTSSCKKCMYLIRHLTLLCMSYSIRVFCDYIPTEQNRWADQLSRMKVAQFLREVKSSNNYVVDDYASTLDRSLWPIPDYLWQ